MSSFIDPYHRESMALWLEVPGCGVGGSFVGLFLGLGDRVALSLSMATDDAQLRDLRIVEKIKYAIDFTFRHSDLKRDCPMDAYPIYSIHLLEKIRAGLTDPAMLLGIDETLDRLRKMVPQE